MTITQIYTLILVSSFPLGIIRYTILQGLNALLSPNKQISASSFYHSLEKLEKQGLIEFLIDEKGKVTLVKTTDKTSEALSQIGHVSILSGMNIEKILNVFTTKIIDSLKIKLPVDTGLIISKDLTLDLHLYPLVEQNVKHIHTLASDIDFNRYIAPFSKKINQTKVLNKKFREPNDEFDVVFLPSYYPSEDFHGMKSEEFWREIVRVTKPNGDIIVVSFKEMVKQNNFLLDTLIDLCHANPMIRFTNEKTIEDEMKKAQVKDIDIKDLNGILLALGKVKKFSQLN